MAFIDAHKISRFSAKLYNAFTTDSISKVKAVLLQCEDLLPAVLDYNRGDREVTDLRVALHAIMDLSDFMHVREWEKEVLDESPAITILCERGLRNFVEIAVNRGVNVNIPDGIQDTGILNICTIPKPANIRMLQSLLRGGLDVDPQTKSYSPYMALALANNQYELMNILHRYDLACALLLSQYRKKSPMHVLPRGIIQAVVHMAGNGLFNTLLFSYSIHCPFGIQQRIHQIMNDYEQNGGTLVEAVEEESSEEEEEEEEEEDSTSSEDEEEDEEAWFW